MKKIVSFLALTFLIVNLSSAQEISVKEVEKDGPKIVVKNEVIDYGEIAYNSNGVREFIVQNTGNAPLIITKTKGSCGCTVPTAPKEPIMPGATAKISVKYDTKRGGMPFSKSVVVYSNAVNSPTKVLKIKGKVLANPNATPTVSKPVKTAIQ